MVVLTSLISDDSIPTVPTLYYNSSDDGESNSEM